jgi:hypothetical protein
MVFRFTAIFLAVFCLAACATPGTAIKDNFALRDLAATADTRIFVRNPTSRSTAQQMHVTLNGKQVAILGLSEAAAVDALVGENKLKAQYFGLIASPGEGVTIDVSMARGQKQFFTAGYKHFHFPIGQKLYLTEITREAFLSY